MDKKTLTLDEDINVMQVDLWIMQSCECLFNMKP